jgi:hypothetical protein
MDNFKSKPNHIQVTAEDDEEEHLLGQRKEDDDVFRFVGITTSLLLGSFFIAVNLDRLETVRTLDSSSKFASFIK